MTGGVDPRASTNINVTKYDNSDRKKPVEEGCKECIRGDEGARKRKDISQTQDDRDHADTEDAVQTDQLIDPGLDAFLPDYPQDRDVHKKDDGSCEDTKPVDEGRIIFICELHGDSLSCIRKQVKSNTIVHVTRLLKNWIRSS